MKIIYLILCAGFLSSIQIKGTGDEMTFIREHFYMAVEDESALEILDSFIVKKYSGIINDYPPVIMAYKAGVEALKAKYVFSPFSKYSYVVSSLDLLETAISRLPGDLEIRFIRFSILDNIPGIFGFGDERESDKKVIISELLKNDFRSIDKETQKGLVVYLLESSNLSDQEKEILKSGCIAYKN